MKYTFLLPAYKTEFLEKSLNSILTQSFDDFNVIVSDDASPFDIKSIVNKFHDNRLIYRRNNKNIGGGQSRKSLEYVIESYGCEVYHYGI